MKILLENDRVRVQEHYLKPGQKIGMHSHPDKVIYAINDWKVRETYPDGTSRVVEGKAGTAVWGTAKTHAVENIGMPRCAISLSSSKSRSRRNRLVLILHPRVLRLACSEGRPEASI